MILECDYCKFSRITEMHSWWDELEVGVLGLEFSLEVRG